MEKPILTQQWSIASCNPGCDGPHRVYRRIWNRNDGHVAASRSHACSPTFSRAALRSCPATSADVEWHALHWRSYPAVSRTIGLCGSWQAVQRILRSSGFQQRLVSSRYGSRSRCACPWHVRLHRCQCRVALAAEIGFVGCGQMSRIEDAHVFRCSGLNVLRAGPMANFAGVA